MQSTHSINTTRVYAILAGQLLATALLVLFFGMNPNVGAWTKQTGSFVPLLSLALSSIAWFLICGSVSGGIRFQFLQVFRRTSHGCDCCGSKYRFGIYYLEHEFQTRPLTMGCRYFIGRNDLSHVRINSPTGAIRHYSCWFLAPSRIMVFVCRGGGCYTKLTVEGTYRKFQMNEKDYVFGAMSP